MYSAADMLNFRLATDPHPMSTPGGSLDAVRSQIGLAHLPLELLRKIAREFSARSHLQAFSLVCRSTLAPARELLFDTLTLSNPGVSLLSSAHLLIGKSRLFPFPDLVRRLVLSRVSIPFHLR